MKLAMDRADAEVYANAGAARAKVNGHEGWEVVPPENKWVLTGGLLLLVALFWSYQPVIWELVRDWKSNDDYSAGMLVPVAALYLAWQQRHRLRRIRKNPCWWGVAVILLAEYARYDGLINLQQSIERYAMVLEFSGLVLLVGGFALFRSTFWILAFLFLMSPMPGQVHNAIAGPLQTQATAGAVFALELLGIPVSRSGNVIVLSNRIPLEVAEACSGLRMLTAFIIVGSVMAYLANRPRWQRITLVISTVPIAIICNLIRLVVTAVLFMHTDSAWAEKFFHDFAGITMMPMAFVFFFLELWIMSKLILEDPPAEGGSSTSSRLQTAQR